MVGGGVDVWFFCLLYVTICQSVLCGSGVGVAVCVIRLVVPVAVGWVGVYGCRSGWR